jgi:hypothetical protein
MADKPKQPLQDPKFKKAIQVLAGTAPVSNKDLKKRQASSR